MKKTLYVLTCALCTLLVLPAAAQVPAYVPTDGLVGWWPFNGNANDESGNGNDGVVNGATLTEDRFGNAGAAYGFDGVDDFIEVDHSTSLSFANQLSVSFWMNSPDYTMGSLPGPERCPLGKQRQAGSGLVFETVDAVETCCGPQFYLNDDMTTLQYEDGEPLFINQWNQITGVYNGTEMSLYLNGNLIGTASDNLDLSSIDQALNFGREGSLNRYFKGSLDDIGIYNRALTDQEIQNLYTGATQPPCVSLPSNLQQGLVGYWPFCGNANDESGNSNDGVVNGATLTEDRFGNAGKAYDFSADGAAIQTALGQSESPASSSDFTMSFWVRRDNSTILNSLLITYKTGDIGSANTSNFDIVHSHGFCPETGGIAVQNYPFNNPSSCSPDTLLNNEWYHIITHYKTVEGTFDVFKNGNFWFNGNLGSVIPGAGILTFGNNDVMDFPTQGQLDDIGIWNRALTPEEVQELYTLDACTFTVYDTLTVYETVYDTVYTYETIYDTVTTYVTVTDTLLIDITFVGFEGQPSWLNTVTVFPNPASDHITIDYGNFALMAGYNTIITDAAGATVYSSAVNSEQVEIDINAWGAMGVYYMSVYDANGELVAVRHIVLE